MMNSMIGVSLAAAVVQFIVGAVWYTPLFGKIWGQIHGFDKLDKRTQKAMMAKMGPIFALQFVVTALTSFVLVLLHQTFPTYSLTYLTGMIWLGFVVPAQVGGVLFGGTKPEWMMAKMLVQAGGSLACLIAGAMVVSFLM